MGAVLSLNETARENGLKDLVRKKKVEGQKARIESRR